MIREYKFPQLENVIFGAGALARVPGELDRFGKQRALVVTGNSLSTKNRSCPQVRGPARGQMGRHVCRLQTARTESYS